jgi:muramoyltetrapeptide carboxypeptidase
MSIMIPPDLHSGDTIGITCPAGFVSQERIAYAVDVLERKGFKVKIGRTIGAREIYFSGSDDERRTDLQDLLDDQEVKAIIMGRGGYGTSRIIDALDFTVFTKSPKWICGFSDITVLHSHINRNLGIATLHSPMCGAFTPESEDSYYIRSLLDALTGTRLHYEISPSAYNRSGTSTGELVGGNLALLAHLTGSVSQLDTRGKILFIEDIGEHLYHIDRMLLNLKRSGQLDSLAGLLVGSFTDTEDTERPFGQTLEQIILDKVAEYDFPVAFNLPCGHDTENVTLQLGQIHTLTVKDGGSSLSCLGNARLTQF